MPDHPDLADFTGHQLHSAHYLSSDEFKVLQVMVVDGGNSAMQILAEVSLTAAKCVWVTLKDPAFLPDDVDGRVHFERSTARWRALH